MNISIRIFGWEVFGISTDTAMVEDDEPTDNGYLSSTPISFGGYYGDQRYEATPGFDY